MKKLYLVGFFALLACDTFAQICFKFTSLASGVPSPDAAWAVNLFSTPWIYGAIAGYLGGFIAWMTLLKHAPVGPAVAASNMELVTITLVSVWLFQEPLNSYKVIGGALILLGVLCLAKGEAEEERKKRLPPPDPTRQAGG